jgi:hypothetical protein
MSIVNKEAKIQLEVIKAFLLHRLKIKCKGKSSTIKVTLDIIIASQIMLKLLLCKMRSIFDSLLTDISMPGKQG